MSLKISVRLPDDLARELSGYCRSTGLSKNAVVNLALIEHKPVADAIGKFADRTSIQSSKKVRALRSQKK